MSENQLVPVADVIDRAVFSPALEPTPHALDLLYERDDALPLFMDALHEAVADAIAADVTTKEGADLIRTTARRIGSVNARLEERGKARTEDYRAKTKRENTVRDSISEMIKAVQAGVRAPLTKFEAEEKERIERVDAVISKIKDRGIIRIEDTSAGVKERLDKLSAYKVDPVVFKDRTQEAEVLLAATVETLQRAVEKLAADEAAAAELAELRRKNAERDAADAAREQREREAAEQAERERQAAEREKAAATAAQEAAEREANERLERQRRAHEAELARIANEAAEAKRKADAEIEAARIAEEARARDFEHRQKVEMEAIDSLIENLGPAISELAPTIIRAIADGNINHIFIKF